MAILQALHAHGVHPDQLVGPSAGAVNAAWVAGHGMSTESLDELAGVWAGLRRSDIFHVDPRQVLRGLTDRSRSITSDTRLRRLVSSHASITDLAHARVPTHLVAADLLSGRDLLISTGDIVEGVLASAAIPGVLPPVELRGQYLVDGSMACTQASPKQSSWGRRSSTCCPPEPPARCQAHPLQRSGWRCTR